jgi:UDP-N-acetylmuramoylalanine--D-glutamate ligase
VIETSSYQALDVEVGPKVVAVTSLSADHVPWHDGDVETYYRDKLSLCTRPGVQTVVADGGDPLLRAHARMLGDSVEWIERSAGAWCEGGALLGQHNRRNAEIARAALTALGVPGAADESALASAFQSFVPLPHRLTPVGEVDAAVDSFPGRRVALLLGGLDRGIDYQPLADGLRGRADLLVVTMPSNGQAIGRLLAPGTAVRDAASLEDAVRVGHEWASAGGVVLLSPAAASFDRFADYRARGLAFEQAMRSLR